MTQTTQLTQAKYDAASKRIESQHDQLLMKLDELDKQIEAVLTQWAPSGASVAPNSNLAK